MLSFKQFIIESEKKIAYHLDKNPKHKDFLDSFLSSNRHNRSKYLDWVTRSLNQSPLTNADQLGQAVDFYHQAKQTQGVIPKDSKDINTFKSHADFINRISGIQNDQPISDKETKYDHPDNNVTYNNKGLKITNIGSHDAAKQIRTCYGGSLCTTMDDSGHYNSYKPGSLHLYEFRNPDSGKVERYFSGLIRNDYEFADLDNKHMKLNKLHPKLQALMYHNGPDKFKGSYEIAPPKEKEKINNQIKLAKNPENHEKLLTYGEDIHPLAQQQMLKNNKNIFPKLIDTVGNKLHPDAQISAMDSKDPSVVHKVIETMGDKLHPEAQISAMYSKDPSVVHKVIDTMGDKLDSYAQRNAIRHADPTVAHKLIDTVGDKLHPDAQIEAIKHADPTVAHKVIKTMGDKLDSYAQRIAMEHTDPTVAHKVIKTMGDKLDSYAQRRAMYNKDPSLVHKVIDTMGDKLYSGAQISAINHKDPSVREKAINLYNKK